jgi:AbrB family looped-hinge helix DNA binding protein
MQKFVLKLSSKNQITVPSPVRRALGVNSNEQVALFIDDEGNVSLRPAKLRTIAELEGILPPLRHPASADFRREIQEAMDDAADKLVRDMGGL